MFCEKCGKEIDDKAVLCIHCNAVVKSAKTTSNNKVLFIILIPIFLFFFIIILGILAALAIPKFLGATEKAKVSEAKTVMKQLVTLQNAYYQYNDAYVSGDSPRWQTDLGFNATGDSYRFNYRTTDNLDSIAIATFKEDMSDVPKGTKVWMNADHRIYTSSVEAQKLLGPTCIIAEE